MELRYYGKIATLVLACLAIQCSEEETPACDKNTSFSAIGENQCAHGRVTQYNRFDNYERFIIAVSNGTMNFELRAISETGPLEENVTYTHPAANFVAQWVDQVNAAKIRFTRIDRAAGAISGEFEFEVQSAHGLQKGKGKFRDIDF